MNAPLVQFMQVRQYRFWILRPKHNNLTMRERYIYLLPIERIIPHAIPLPQAVEEPLGVKGRDIRGAAGGYDDGGGSFNLDSSIYMNLNFHLITYAVHFIVYSDKKFTTIVVISFKISKHTVEKTNYFTILMLSPHNPKPSIIPYLFCHILLID